ncbi:hypothetical protein Mboo_0645 [Methanoregula boonei 6A8]|uniref:Uncharacterized protein n=1 Tax=Methanoregula boonei (strain DSM 21154 / JCM 14090 / 6A8) TaxID=456442 RepID=A7I602_METB6|nr:hypothetical protein Mboo_0645 [Methanoregula boonei 6A8]
MRLIFQGGPGECFVVYIADNIDLRDNPILIYRSRQNFLNMPRGRPKGSRNLSAYERGKVKRIRELLSQKGIGDFDRLRDNQVLNTIYVNTDGEIFVKYGLETAGAEEKAPRSRASEKIIAKLEKNIALLRDVL